MMLRKIVLLILTGMLLGVGTAVSAAEPDGSFRIIGTSEMVVVVKPDGSLDYYEIVAGEGNFLGTTPPGWHNNNQREGVISRVASGKAITVELSYVGNNYYVVTYYDATGSRLWHKDFNGADGRIPNAASSASAVETAPTDSQAAAAADNGSSFRARGAFDGTYYTVVKGDNLYRIALRFNTTFSGLQDLNNLPNINHIEVGDRIRIR